MSTAADATAATVSSVKSWASAPFSSSMSVGGWFLFFGLVMAIAAAWALILNDLRGEL